MPEIVKLITSASSAAFGFVVPQQMVVGVCDGEKEEQGGAGAATALPW